MGHIESKIEELKCRADERERMRYTQSFREDAVQVVSRLRADGFTQNGVSERLEIPWVTLARWKESNDEAKAPEGSSGFRPVKVVDDPGPAEAGLFSPAGWRIEGLTVAELVEVARRLS